MLTRKPEEYIREKSSDLHRIRRNYDPVLHPLEKAREYTRALNAVKLERMFAKPFVGALNGHKDGVYCMAKNPRKITSLISGSGDGGELNQESNGSELRYIKTKRMNCVEIRLWDLADRTTVWSVQGHKGIVKGLCCSPTGNVYLSCGLDKTVKVWNPDVSTEVR